MGEESEAQHRPEPLIQGLAFQVIPRQLALPPEEWAEGGGKSLLWVWGRLGALAPSYLR